MTNITKKKQKTIFKNYDYLVILVSVLFLTLLLPQFIALALH